MVIIVITKLRRKGTGKCSPARRDEEVNAGILVPKNEELELFIKC